MKTFSIGFASKYKIVKQNFKQLKNPDSEREVLSSTVNNWVICHKNFLYDKKVHHDECNLKPRTL